MWITASQKHFEWLVDIIKNVEEHDKNQIVETHIFITQMFHQFDLRTTMLVSLNDLYGMYTDRKNTLHDKSYLIENKCNILGVKWPNI